MDSDTFCQLPRQRRVWVSRLPAVSAGEIPNGCRRRCPAPSSFVSSVGRGELELPNLEKPQCSSHKNHVYGRGGAYSVILHDGLGLPRRSPSTLSPHSLLAVF